MLACGFAQPGNDAFRTNWVQEVIMIRPERRGHNVPKLGYETFIDEVAEAISIRSKYKHHHQCS